MRSESFAEFSRSATKFDGSFPQRAEANFQNEVFGRVAKAIWKKPDAAIAAIAGVSDRAAREYLRGRVPAPAVVVAAIIVAITKKP